MSKSKFRLAAAALSALAVAGMGMSPVAFADPGNPTLVGGESQEAANPALINPTATTQLTIHKYSGAPTGDLNDGTELEGTPAGVAPLEGATFTIYRVPEVDLTTNAGWEEATAYYESGTFDTTGVTPADVVTTDAAGLATARFTNGVGLYYVVETAAPAGYTAAAPFFVTLPMTQPSGDSAEVRWMYDVNVYPKNQMDEITKTVEDRGTVTTEGGIAYGDGADHQIDYTITSSITDGEAPLGMYVIYDDLDPALTLTGASLVLDNDVSLIAGTDYNTYTYDNSADTTGTLFSGTAVPGGPMVKIVMTDGGLTKLAANRAANVLTTLNTMVAAKDADGIVPNDASFIPNASWWQQNVQPTDPRDPEDPTTPPTDDPGIPSEEVVTKYAI